MLLEYTSPMSPPLLARGSDHLPHRFPVKKEYTWLMPDTEKH